MLTNKNKDITLQIVAFVISDDESISKFKIDSLHWIIRNFTTKDLTNKLVSNMRFYRLSLNNDGAILTDTDGLKQRAGRNN